MKGRDLIVDIVGVRKASGIRGRTQQFLGGGLSVDIAKECPAVDVHDSLSRETHGLGNSWWNVGSGAYLSGVSSNLGTRSPRRRGEGNHGLGRPPGFFTPV